MKPARSSVPTASVRRILFVRPRFLGDVCLTLPAVDAALAACPGAQAAYVTEAPLAPLLEGDPRFAEVVAIPARRPRNPGTRRQVEKRQPGMLLKIVAQCWHAFKVS